MVTKYTVQDSLASKVTTIGAAICSAHAVSECRVIVGLLLKQVPPELDQRLFSLELAYFRRCDELTAKASLNKKPPKKRARRKG
jgi:hypothetical protein